MFTLDCPPGKLESVVSESHQSGSLCLSDGLEKHAHRWSRLHPQDPHEFVPSINLEGAYSCFLPGVLLQNEINQFADSYAIRSW